MGALGAGDAERRSAVEELLWPRGGTDLHASVDVMRHAYPARQSAGAVRAKDAVLAFAEASAENEFR